MVFHINTALSIVVPYAIKSNYPAYLCKVHAVSWRHRVFLKSRISGSRFMWPVRHSTERWT